jgi:hypothetical protein
MYDIRRCLSYEDILLVPGYSDVEGTGKADLKYKYSDIPIPFESEPIFNSPMDMVCSVPLLRYLHDEKGFPITIHRYFKTVEDQIE